VKRAQDEEELSFHDGELLYLIRDDGEWWLAENQDGVQGFIPSNYVEQRD